MSSIDKCIVEELEEAFEDKIQDFASSIYGVLCEYNLHEKEPYIGNMVEEKLDDLKEFIINFLTQYIKD